jgi:flavin-dependent dehydrogenase
MGPSDRVGWTLDRQRFERFLWRQCEPQEGARVMARVRGIHRRGDRWEIELATGAAVEVRFILDCSGRAGVAGRTLARRRRHSRLVAAYDFLEQEERDIEPTAAVMVEARPEGWWYSSLTPSRRLVVAFFSDADLLPGDLTRDRARWCAQLASAPYTWRRIQSAGYVVRGLPAVTDAGTLHLECPAGDGWAAAGDAALALDPLASHGITIALWSGRKAALAATAALSGDAGPLRDYANTVVENIPIYESELAKMYAGERRFAEAAFWRRR